MTDRETPSAIEDRGPVEHELKCWPQYFPAVLDGSKPFEVRKTDRDYRVGDTLWLREWALDWRGLDREYTGRECRRLVTFILEGAPWVPPGYCVMGLRDPVPSERDTALSLLITAAVVLAEYVRPNRMKHITEVKLIEAVDAYKKAAPLVGEGSISGPETKHGNHAVRPTIAASEKFKAYRRSIGCHEIVRDGHATFAILTDCDFSDAQRIAEALSTPSTVGDTELLLEVQKELRRWWSCQSIGACRQCADIKVLAKVDRAIVSAIAPTGEKT